MSGSSIDIKPTCVRCGKLLTIDEMHFYDQGNGTATCNECEGKWMAEVAEWRSGERDEFPQR